MGFLKNGIEIIPEPVEVDSTEGYFCLNSNTQVEFCDEFQSFESYFWDFMPISTEKNKNHVEPTNNSKTTIRFLCVKSDNFGDEKYSIQIEPELIRISASHAKGILYAIQTFRQLIPADFADPTLKLETDEIISIPCCKIVDYPRFSYRGLMIDEGRWFLGKKAVKKIIDYMVLHKLNNLHWHLTEDQGWRIEIKAFPKLTEIGSKRSGTPKYRNINKKSNNIPHEGYYTQADIKEIVAYAEKFFVKVIPEIEIPGHATAALASYPEYSCSGSELVVSPKWGVHKNILCVGKPKTYDFVRKILEEVVNLFPSNIIHTGGDEVPKDAWKTCPRCQKEIHAHNLANEHSLQVHFSNQIASFLNQFNKKTMIWNEVVDPALSKDIIIQFWRGSPKDLHEFIEAGGKVIISPSSHYYLDITYEHSPLSKVYSYSPNLDGIAENLQNQILGVEACIWGEVIDGMEKFEYCVFPRLGAIAESAWSQEKKKNWKRFSQKLQDYLHLLEKLGINFAPPADFEPNSLKKLKNRLHIGFGHYL